MNLKNPSYNEALAIFFIGFIGGILLTIFVFKFPHLLSETWHKVFG